MMVIVILALLVVASWIYWLVAFWLVRSFFRKRQEPDPAFAPPVSILKPLRGLDAGIYRNFVSFCQQDYPEYELLFGVSEADDPVIDVVQRLQQDYPEQSIRLVITPADRVNRKAALLHALAGQASHQMLVVSDSDMRVTPDYLRRVVAPLADPQVGLVTCLYRGVDPATFTARLEALHMGATFLPSVLVARQVLAMRFAMGATVALRSADLAEMGGFAAVADYLADDYQLGAHIADLGLRVHLSDYVVNSVLGPTTFHDQWDREVRWAHCNRVSRPLEYPGLLLTFSTPFSALLVVASGFDLLGWLALLVSVLLRWAVGWQVMGYTDSQDTRRWLLWLPVRDVLSALIWCGGAVGRRVVWRGEVFILQPDGKLASPRPVGQPLLAGGDYPLFRKMIRGVDGLFQKAMRIQAFSDDELCLLRISVDKSHESLILSDGTRVHRRDPIGKIYLWNEHIPQIPPEGPNLAWARAFQRQAAYSFRLLAAHVRDNPDFDDVQAFTGEISFGAPYDPAHATMLARRWGFDVLRQDGARGLLTRIGDYWEGLYALSLILAFNPGSVEPGKAWKMRRDQLWISRKGLLSRYGSPDRATEMADRLRRPHDGRPEPVGSLWGPGDGSGQHSLKWWLWRSDH
jgi:ceramide glucosyltransferase